MSLFPGRIAHHEAGHAIIGTCFGLKVNEISIQCGTGGLSGYVQFEIGYSQISRELETWQNMSLIIAGSVAEYSYNGVQMKEFDINDLNGSAHDCASDIRKFYDLANGSIQDNTSDLIKHAINYTGSRLIRNEHHLRNLADLIKRSGSINRNQFDQWFNRATKHDEFYY